MGGASLGIHKAGFKILKAYDIFEDALLTHKHNLPNVETSNSDIAKLEGVDIPYADYMHFSPPCQSFSTSGSNKGIDDLRGKLIYEPIRIEGLKIKLTDDDWWKDDAKKEKVDDILLIFVLCYNCLWW